MDGETRRKIMIGILSENKKPVSGTKLSEMLHVSRQIIVQDISMLKKDKYDILSTHSGYLLLSSSLCSRVLKFCHTDTQIEEELNAIVDHGGIVRDVFIRHRFYGEMHASLNIASRLDVQNFKNQIDSGKSTPLKNLTSNYHYHTIEAVSENILDLIEEDLKKRNFLAEMLEYEKQ